MKKTHKDFKTNLQVHRLDYNYFLDKFQLTDLSTIRFSERLKVPKSILNNKPFIPEILRYQQLNQQKPSRKEINKCSNPGKSEKYILNL